MGVGARDAMPTPISILTDHHGVGARRRAFVLRLSQVQLRARLTLAVGRGIGQ